MSEISSSNIPGDLRFDLSRHLQRMHFNIFSPSSYIPGDQASSLLWQQQRVPRREMIEKLHMGQFPLNPHATATTITKEVLSAAARYLCYSNGLEIFCLDLEQSHDHNAVGEHPAPLPKITTLIMAGEGLPSSVGLFKMGPDAYMIGGQLLPYTVEKPKYICDDEWGTNPGGFLLYTTLCRTFMVKGTSCDTYGLSLVGGAVSHSKSNIYKLKYPKLWPIVEKIDGKIHVIDSVPPLLFQLCPGWLFTHEVLNPDSGREGVIPTIEGVGYISSHCVVGHRIYAVTATKGLMFDCKTEEWEAPQPRVRWGDLFSVKKVWHILDRGVGRCVGGLTLYVEKNNPLYVLIAVAQPSRYHGYSVHAVAYLVNLAGQVICIQRLPHFFEGPMKLHDMEVGTIFNVDEEGKIMCSIANGSARNDKAARNIPTPSGYVFINTFTVEMLTSAASKVRQLWAKGEEAWPVEQDFVRVHVKNRYVYTAEDKSDRWLGVRACFL